MTDSVTRFTPAPLPFADFPYPYSRINSKLFSRSSRAEAERKTFPRINRLCAKRTWWPVVRSSASGAATFGRSRSSADRCVYQQRVDCCCLRHSAVRSSCSCPTWWFGWQVRSVATSPHACPAAMGPASYLARIHPAFIPERVDERVTVHLQIVSATAIRHTVHCRIGGHACTRAYTCKMHACTITYAGLYCIYVLSTVHYCVVRLDRER